MTQYDIIERLIDREGGTSDHPADAGGLTRWGISKAAFPKLDVAHLTRARAHGLYVSCYYVPAKCSLVPEPIREIYFDMAVQHGADDAVRILQWAVNGKRGGRDPIRVDGVLGPVTLAALVGLEPDRVRAYRVLYYAGLVADKPSQEAFWFGWFRRATSV